MITTIEHIKAMAGMSNNICDKRITPYLQEVEDAILVPAIGVDLYEQLSNGEETDDILLNGGYYTNQDGKRAICYGIYKAVAYVAYSKMLHANKISVTAFGVVEKSSTYSDPASKEDITYTAEHNEKMGMYYLQSVVDYLNDKTTPCECEKKTRKEYGRITYKVIH